MCKPPLTWIDYNQKSQKPLNILQYTMYKYAFTFKLTLKNRQWNQVYCNVKVAPFHTYTRDTNR